MDVMVRIGTIEKNALAEIGVCLGELKGQQRVDIRVYWAPGSDPSERVPTKKGVNMTVEQARELVKILSNI